MENIKNIKSIMDVYDPQRLLQEQTRAIVKKWDSYEMLEECNNDYEKYNLAMQLENQTRRLITEASTTGTSAGSEEWAGIALPTVKKLFKQMSTKEFMTVQTLNQPFGRVFYQNLKYANTKSPFNSGDDMYGVLDKPGDPTGGLYGGTRYQYTLNMKSASIANVSGSLSAGPTTATLARIDQGTWMDVQFEPKLSASVAANQIYKISVNKGSLVDPDLLAVRSFRLGHDTVAFTNLPLYTTTTDTDITFFVSHSTITTLTNLLVYYNQQPQGTNRGDFERNSNNVGPDGKLLIPRFDLGFSSKDVVPKTRKLAATWTPEFAQDIGAFQAVDAEAIITDTLAEYTAAEIDQENIDMLVEAAPTVDYWSARVGFTFDAAAKRFVAEANPAGRYNAQEWYQTLAIKINKLSKIINQKTLRGGANFLITSPVISSIIESLNMYKSDVDGGKEVFALGLEKSGTFNQRIKVYTNPYMTENVILLGFRGTNYLETGAAFCPYIPFMTTPVVLDPVDFTPSKGILTRNAKVMLRSEFFAKIIVAGLDAL